MHPMCSENNYSKFRGKIFQYLYRKQLSQILHRTDILMFRGETTGTLLSRSRG